MWYLTLCSSTVGNTVGHVMSTLNHTVFVDTYKMLQISTHPFFSFLFLEKLEQAIEKSLLLRCHKGSQHTTQVVLATLGIYINSES